MGRMKKWITRYGPVCLLVVTIFPEHSFCQSSHYHRKIDKATILFLFQHRLYPSLNSKLEECQSAYDQDYEEEDNVFDAFAVFHHADPSYEPIFNEWVQKFPSSYVPFMARAEYYSACGWKSRGGAWANQTSEKQFDEMKRYFVLAMQDIADAIKINPQLDVGYEMMISIGSAVSNEELKENSLAEALKHHPYAHRVRKQYLYSLTPRWGGSYNKMEKFVDEAERSSMYNPRLKMLRAAIPADKGSIAAIEGNYDDAVKFYTEALKYANQASSYALRGMNQERLLDNRRALADYEQALALDPNNPEYLRYKAGVLYKLNRLSDAQAVIELAERLDPNDEWIQKKKKYLKSDGVQAYDHSKKGYDLLKNGEYKEAIQELTEAIRLNPDGYVSYYNRGISYLQLGNENEALQDFHHVIERKRDYIDAYDKICWINFRKGRYDEALEATNEVLKLKPNNAEAVFNRAMIYAKKNWTGEAMRDARQACDMGYQKACVLYDQMKH
jgi:tetratricopeptide (TPR) repeat protein